MIRRRDPGHFGSSCPVFSSYVNFCTVDALAGPIILSIALFIGVLANFILRGSFSSLPRCRCPLNCFSQWFPSSRIVSVLAPSNELLELTIFLPTDKGKELRYRDQILLGTFSRCRELRFRYLGRTFSNNNVNDDIRDLLLSCVSGPDRSTCCVDSQ
jgi:hypothetical protein